MHKFKQFVDDSLEELPVGPQKPWVLPHHIHDVGGYDSLVVFAPLLFTQTKQILPGENSNLANDIDTQGSSQDPGACVVGCGSDDSH